MSISHGNLQNIMRNEGFSIKTTHVQIDMRRAINWNILRDKYCLSCNCSTYPTIRRYKVCNTKNTNN